MNMPVCRHSFHRVRPGFTLTELMVVVLIIVVLALVALFGVRRLRDGADKSVSARNLAQIQIANMTYATENNGRFVPIRVNDDKGNPTRWFQDLEFLSNLTGIPFDDLDRKMATPIPLQMLDPKVVRARKPLHDRIYTSYGMNDTGLQLGGEPNLNSGHNLNKLADPSRTMAFATATDFRVTYNSRFKWNFENPNDSKTANGEIAFRHNDKVLVVYFDGHCGELGKADFERFDKSGGKGNPFWKP